MLVAGRPFLAHQLKMLHARGLRHAILCIGYLGEMIQRESATRRSASNWIIPSTEKNCSALAALSNARRPKLGEDFFILYGDSYLPWFAYALLQVGDPPPWTVRQVQPARPELTPRLFAVL